MQDLSEKMYEAAKVIAEHKALRRTFNEQKAYDEMPESLQESEEGEKCEDTANELDICVEEIEVILARL
jgi:hypothetical protein